MLMIYLFQKKSTPDINTKFNSSSLYNFLTLLPSFSDLWVKELCCRYITNNLKITCSLYPLWFSKETCLGDKGKHFCSSHVIQLFHMRFCFFIILRTFHTLWMPLPLLVFLVVTLCFCLSNFKSIPSTFYQNCPCSLNIALRMPVALFLFSNTTSLTINN